MDSLNYSSVAFLLVRPPAKVLSTHKLNNKADHEKLLQQAKDKNACVYYAVVVRKGNKLFAKQPWTLDNSTLGNIRLPIPEVAVETSSEPEPVVTDKLRCPYCKKPFSSTSGRTLHVKSKHLDMWDDYTAEL